MDIQFSKFKKALAETTPKVCFHRSHLTMILVDREELLVLLNNRQNQSNDNPIKCEIYGKTCYDLDLFEITIQWSVNNAAYAGSKGVLPLFDKVQIDNFSVSKKDQRVQLSEGSKKIAEKTLFNYLNPLFSEQIEDWKTHPSIFATAMQPTHYKVKQEMLAGLVVDNVVSIFEGTFPQLKKKIASQVTFIKTYQTNAILDDIPMMFGYAVYRIGSLEDAMFVHLHWVIRVKADKTADLPEFALVETEHDSGAMLTGASLIDSSGEPIAQEQEIIAILRLLQFDKSWIQNTIRLFLNWLDGANNKINKLSAVEIEGITKKFSSENDGQEPNKKIPKYSKEKSQKLVQRSLFDSEQSNSLDSSGDTVQRHIVYNGKKPIEFLGNLIAQVEEKNDDDDITYGIYKTDSNQWICSTTKKNLGNSQIICKAELCDNHSQIISFFGLDSIAKKLYAEAKIIFESK